MTPLRLAAAFAPVGHVVAAGKLRGELPELRSEHRVLSIGLFDGIGALRVALDLLGVEVLGHISVEQDAQARRVVEAHFPEVVHVEDVNLVDEDLVHQWAGLFSQAGGGSGRRPPLPGGLGPCLQSLSLVSGAVSYGKRVVNGRM